MKGFVIVFGALICSLPVNAQHLNLQAAPIQPIAGSNAFHLKPIAPDAYTKHLGFFCKQEINMDKKLAVPIRFRLGSVEQCNYLEQKTGYNKKVE